MPNQMKMNILYLLGSMMLRQKAMAYVAGIMIHGAVSIAFVLAHVGVYRALGLASNLVA